MILRASAVLLAVGLVALSGCGPAKLDVTKKYTLDSDPQIVILDAQSKPQKITVDFDASSNVTVLLIKSADCPSGDEGVIGTDKAIVFKKGEKAGTFSGDVPENTEARVIIRNAAPKTTVTLHVTNR